MAKPVGSWLSAFEDFTKDLRISSKESVSQDDRGVKLDMWMSQRMFLKDVAEGLDCGQRSFFCLKSRQLGLCLDPDTKVLRADLRWVKISDLKPGDEVVAVDEKVTKSRGVGRRMRTATVLGVVEVSAPAYRISFDDGRSVICTGRHPWLTRRHSGSDTLWRALEYRPDLGSTNRNGLLRIGSQVRWITKPWGPPDLEDAWFSGMLDGEGSISNKGRSGFYACVSQRAGPVWDRLVRYATERGYSFRLERDETKPIRPSKFGRTPVPKLEFSRMDELFRLIGQTRPTRFKDVRFWEDRELPGKKSGIGWATITGIEFLGERPMIDLQTTHSTYIAEGFVSHNTTISLVVDLFWLAVHRDLTMALVTDTEKNRDADRLILARYVASFPEGYFGEDFSIVKNNNKHITFSNGSRLDFLVAGVKKKPTSWGEGIGYAAAHLTEVSSYGDEEGLESFEEAFAQKNPSRLFIYESTAKGFNHWRDKWKAAEANPILGRAMFYGWWSGDTNRIERSDPLFRIYGNYPASGDERERCQLVKHRYGVTISPEQLAWIRWRTDKSDDSQMSRQNQPWLPDEAFVQTGYSFFQVRNITMEMKRLETADDAGYQAYRYEFGATFFDIKLVFIGPDDDSERELKIWEEPIEGAKYTIGCDTAWGRNDHKDRSVISIWRCYADKMVQVAEYASNDIEIKQLAWVLAHLAGAYRDCIVNPEVNGPGAMIITEWEALRGQLNAEWREKDVKARDWEDALAYARWYLYNRPDSMGAGFAVGFETSWKTKQQIMHQMRGEYVTGTLHIRSMFLLQEMTNVIQDGSSIGAPESRSESSKDDRVFAAALAIRAWINWIRQPMVTNGQTYAIVTAKEKGEESVLSNRLNRHVFAFFKTAEEKAQMQPSNPQFLTDRGLR